MPENKSKPAESEAVSPLSDNTRGLITLFLLLHLFCIFVAATAAISPSPSPLQTRFLSVVRPYVRVLNFELTNAQYNLNLAFPSNENADYRLEYQKVASDSEGDEEGEWGALPDVGTRGSDRYHRYQRLSRQIAYLHQVGDRNSAPMEAAAARLVQGTAKRLWLEEKLGSGGRIRCRQHRPIFLDAIASGNEEQRDPNSSFYINDPYSATIIVNEGIVFVNKESSRSEVAQPDSEGNQNES